MIKQRKIINFDLNRRPSTSESNFTLPQLVISAQRTAKHHLRALLPKFFSSIDDSLFELADKAETNQQQTLYFDAMREVRLQKDVMQKSYFDALEAGYKASLTQTAQQRTGSLDQAGLVEDEQLEESLAITNMINGAESSYREALFGLTARLDFLIEEIDITKNNNPLRPEVLFSAFTPAVQQMDAGIKVRLVIYKLFDKFVAQKIGPVYEAINADLIAAGVLPRIKSTIRKSQDGYVSSSSEDLAANAMGAETAIASEMPFIDPNQPTGFFDSLQQLLSMQRAAPVTATTAGGLVSGAVHGNSGVQGGSTGGTGAAADNTTGAANYSPQDVLAALSALQTGATLPPLHENQDQPSAVIIKTSVVEEIHRLQGGGDTKHIDQADTDAIDIVSMLFDFILDDPSLQDRLKAQIVRLQIPLLKVAILDKEFFAKKAHPARQLLNELAYAGSGLEEVDPEEDAVYQMVSYVVDSVLAEFEENTEIFASLLAEFTEFMDKERETNKLAGEMLENARDLVAGEIQRRIIDNRVPPLVSAILVEAWKDVLTHLYLRDGEEGAAWNTALQVADDLIWSVQPKLVVSERQRLIKIIPRVLNGLRDGLTLIRFDAKATEQLFSGLEGLHLASLRGGIDEKPQSAQIAEDASFDLGDDDFGVDLSSLPESTEKNAGESIPQTANDSFMEEIILASTQPTAWLDEQGSGQGGGQNRDTLLSSEYAEEIRGMALGVWVEFVDPETEQCKRGKLAWKCDFTGEYTFIDRKYQVVADLSFRKLIAEFELGRAAFVDDVPLFDRALDSIIGGIKRVLEGQDKPPQSGALSM